MRKIFFTLFFLLFASIGFAQEKAVYPVVVLGSGVGGLTSAIYLGLAGISPLVIEGDVPGGGLSQSFVIHNWPGESEIKGSDLIEKIRRQAQESGSRFQSGNVVSVDLSQKPFLITIQESMETKNLYADKIIIAMGTEPKVLEEKISMPYLGKGVSLCALCDGALYKNKRVAVVGGGESALQEAEYLSNIAKKVFVILRKESFSSREQERKKKLLQKENVEVFYQTTVKEILGNGEGVTSLMLENLQEKKNIDLPIQGVFLAVGNSPKSEIFKGKLEQDSQGYIKVKDEQKTSVEGVFAIGDITRPGDHQALFAASDGAKAAIEVIRSLETKVEKQKNFLEKKEEKTMEGCVEIKSVEQFEKELKEAKTIVLVDFYAIWCGPCQRIAPIMGKFAQKFPDKVKVLKVNVDTLGDLSEKYSISSMPTLMVFDAKGKALSRKVGTNEIFSLLLDLEKLKESFETYFQK